MAHSNTSTVQVVGLGMNHIELCPSKLHGNQRSYATILYHQRCDIGHLERLPRAGVACTRVTLGKQFYRPFDIGFDLDVWKEELNIPRLPGLGL